MPVRAEKKIEASTPSAPVRHPAVVALSDVDTDNLTPLEALKLLTEWKLLWGTNRDD